MSKKPFDLKQYIQNNKFELEREINTGKNITKGYNDIRKTLLNEVKIVDGKFDLKESMRGDKKEMSEDTKRKFLEIISTYSSYQEQLKRKSDLVEISKTLGAIVEAAKHLTLNEADDWFDKVTIKRNMKELEKFDKEFDKISEEAQALDNRMHALYEDMGHILNRYYEISDINEDEMKRRLGEKKKKVNEVDSDYANDFQDFAAKKLKREKLNGWQFYYDERSGTFEFSPVRGNTDLLVMATPFWDGNDYIPVNLMKADSGKDLYQDKINFKATDDMNRDYKRYMSLLGKLLKKFEKLGR